LTPEERARVVDTFAELLEGLYAHLPLKRARYGSDPLQRLRILRQQCDQIGEGDFHYRLAKIITELRDAHTRYVGPATLAGRAAMLPFLVEAWGTASRPRFVVSKVADDPALIPDPAFKPGVELTHWNAVPIAVAVDRQADDETGGRPDSRRARALQSLTIRALQYGPPPAEEWVIVGYLDHNGTPQEIRFDWRMVHPRRARTAQGRDPLIARAYAIDPASEVARRVKKLLYAGDRWYDDSHGTAPRRLPTNPDAEGWLPTTFQDVVAAKVVPTAAAGKLGYLRLWSFDVADDTAFVTEVRRLLEQLPTRGLIIDLRGNPGGLIWAAERLLQLLTPNPVTPTRFSLLATPLTRAMAAADQNELELQAWKDSLDATVGTGELYSQAVPITPPQRCNDIGQVYGGPVVAVVDANTYSASDLFAAGFVDNGIGTLVTVGGEATGAGGANMWTPDDVAHALLGTPFQQEPLPAGIGYTLSVRRATRVRDADGAAIEDIGVTGQRTYPMSKRDLTHNNQDLLAFCARLLKNTPITGLHVQRTGNTLKATCTGLTRLDIYVDDKPTGWRPVQTGPITIDIPDGTELTLLGWAGDELAQRRRITLNPPPR
jgi:Peptidase family S41